MKKGRKRLFRVYVGDDISYPVIWVFPKIMGKPPKPSILIGFFMKETIHFGGFTTPIFGSTHGDYFVNHSKDSYDPTRIQWKVSGRVFSWL